MKCPSCGADIAEGSSRCEYCGSSVPRQPVHAPPAAASSPFERIKQSPQYALHDARERLERLPQPGMIATAIPVVFFLVFIAASGFIALMALTMGFGGIGMMFAIVPLGFVVIGVLMLVATLQKAAKFRSSDSIGQPAIIRAKRTEVSGGGRDSSATTSYYITAEFETGDRQEFAAESDLYARVAEGDAGVLYTRADVAQDFDRVA
jgi:hypothetical protein